MSVENKHKVELHHPEIENLLEPVAPSEFLGQTAQLYDRLGRFSEWGNKTSKGYILVFSEGNLGWQPITSATGAGEEILWGWEVIDETDSLALEMQAKLAAPYLKKYNPRRLRFNAPGTPYTSVVVETFNHLDVTEHLNVVITTGNYGWRFLNTVTPGAERAKITCYKRSMGAERFITLDYINGNCNSLKFGQESGINSKYYAELELLFASLSQFYRASNDPHKTIEIKNMLLGIALTKFDIPALCFGIKLDGDEMRDFKEQLLLGEIPLNIIREFLKKTSLKPDDQDRYLFALSAETDRVKTPLGMVTASFGVKKSTAESGITRIFPPRIFVKGQIEGLKNHWRQAAGIFASNNLKDFVRLEGELKLAMYKHLGGVLLLASFGVQFPEDEFTTSGRETQEPED